VVKNGEASYNNTTMFIGEYKTSITEGFRVAIPKKLREKLQSNTWILTKGFEGCVVLVEQSHFEKLLDGVQDLPFVMADKRETSRFLLASAHEVIADRQGRVVLPSSLINHAAIKDKGNVCVVGVGMWIEIWDGQAWDAYQDNLSSQAPEIADRLARLNSSSNS
jgi:MraZ protein